MDEHEDGVPEGHEGHHHIHLVSGFDENGEPVDLATEVEQKIRRYRAEMAIQALTEEAIASHNGKPYLADEVEVAAISLAAMELASANREIVNVAMQLNARAAVLYRAIDESNDIVQHDGEAQAEIDSLEGLLNLPMPDFPPSTPPAKPANEQ